MRLRLNLLGGLNLELEGFHRPKPLLLLAYLALEGKKEKRHVQELFWSDAANPAGSLRTAMNQIRQVSSNLILSDEHTVWTTVENDLTALQSAISERDATRVETLYRGEFLHGFSLPDWGAELEEWVLSTREFLAARVRGTFIRAAESEASKGVFDLAAKWAEKAFATKRQDQTPEDLEHLYPLLIAADSVLADEVRKQAKEYGLELRLSRDEARGRYVTATLESSTQARAIPHNLPRAKTSFIGRDPELVELGQLIGQPEVQLLTLLGPGGIGKTRLSLQLAAGQLEEANFPDGVYFVALESLNKPAQIPLVLAQTLHIKLKDDPFAALKSAIAGKHMLLVLDNFEHLVDGALLVSELLENCPKLTLVVTSRERLNLEEEHVLPLQGLPFPTGSSFAESQYVDAIELFVQRANRAKLDFQLSPENLPFVLEVCKLVEGSPLGIELASAWLRSLSLPDLVREIATNRDVLETSSRNVPGRHQSLRAVFEHSWKLLKPKEQLVLARLSVFRGGFTREAASSVADTNLGLLAALVNKSVLRLSETEPGSEGRYDFHPLLLEYAKEKCAGFDEQEHTRAKHAHYFLALVEASNRDGLQAQIKCCKREYENLLAALAWSQEHHQGLFGLRLGILLGTLWQSQGYNGEGIHWLRTVLSHPEAASASAERFQALILISRIAMIHAEHVSVGLAYGEEALALARTLENDEYIVQALLRLSLVAQKQNDWTAVQEYGEARLALARKLEHPGLIANALWIVGGALAFIAGDYVKSRSYLEESVSISRNLGLRPETGLGLSNLGFLVFLLGDLQAAKTHLEEALRIAQDLPDLYTVSVVQDSLSAVMQDLGDLDSARSLANQALKYNWQIQNTMNLRNALENLASLAVLQGKAKRASQLWGVAERLHFENASGITVLWHDRNERFMTMAKAQLDETSFHTAWQEGRTMKLEEAVSYALETTVEIAHA
jgi:predicted ATPase